MQKHVTEQYSLWVDKDKWSIHIIDQTKLPFSYETIHITSWQQALQAINTMQVRGAPLIGIMAAYGIGLGLREQVDFDTLKQTFLNSRPTAVNLKHALDQITQTLQQTPLSLWCEAAYACAQNIHQHDQQICYQIGKHGLDLIKALYQTRSQPINILTHCNTGWLATSAWGTALSAIYQAHLANIPLHVWVDETRPRNQGSFLSAWELAQSNIPHTIIADNTGGLLMQKGQVDMCIVGTDRVAYNGDVANKIGTYLKALSAKAHDIPFYVAAPSSSIDWSCACGDDIMIETRHADELHYITGITENGTKETIRITPEASPALNYAFDITPNHYITKLITERGVCEASSSGIDYLFPECQPSLLQRKY